MQIYFIHIMINVEKILNNLKKELNLKNDLELSKFLGIKQNTLSTWKSRNFIDVIRILNKIQDYDILKLLNGEENFTKNGIMVNKSINYELPEENFGRKVIKEPKIEYSSNVPAYEDENIKIVINIFIKSKGDKQ